MSVHFDATTHTYSTDDGIVLPSVTTILGAAQLVNATFYTDDARQRGSDAHEAIKAFLMQQRDTFPAHIAAYVSHVARYLRDADVEPLLIEEPLSDETRRFAGTPDLVARFKRRHDLIGVIDVKTGARERWHAFQLEAYSQLVFANTGEHVGLRVALYVNADGYRAIDEPATNWAYNARVWDAALCLYHERHGGDDTWRATRVN